MSWTFTPPGDKVLIRPHSEGGRRTTESGLEVVSDFDPTVMGEVVAVGDGLRCKKCKTKTPIPFSSGDKVVFPYSSGIEIRMGDETFLVMKASDIHAILEEA